MAVTHVSRMDECHGEQAHVKRAIVQGGRDECDGDDVDECDGVNVDKHERSLSRIRIHISVKGPGRRRRVTRSFSITWWHGDRHNVVTEDRDAPHNIGPSPFHYFAPASTNHAEERAKRRMND
jgi:hypothetical protein